MPAEVERLIRDLRAEVRALSLHTQALEARIALLEEFEVVQPAASPREPSAPPRASTPPLSTPPRASGSAAPAASSTSSLAVGPPEDFVDPSDTAGRTALAREIGGFLRRSLEGGYRGSSGRNRLRLQSRLYVALSDHTNTAFAEPRVFYRLSDLRSSVFFRGNPGEATFIGFASQWEARVALGEAGVAVPASLN